MNKNQKQFVFLEYQDFDSRNLLDSFLFDWLAARSKLLFETLTEEIGVVITQRTQLEKSDNAL